MTAAPPEVGSERRLVPRWGSVRCCEFWVHALTTVDWGRIASGRVLADVRSVWQRIVAGGARLVRAGLVGLFLQVLLWYFEKRV